MLLVEITLERMQRQQPKRKIFEITLAFTKRSVRGGPLVVLMAEWQILCDPIGVSWSDELCFAQGAAAFGTLALKQVAFARASMQDFAGAGNFETFGN